MKVTRVIFLFSVLLMCSYQSLRPWWPSEQTFFRQAYSAFNLSSDADYDTIQNAIDCGCCNLDQELSIPDLSWAKLGCTDARRRLLVLLKEYLDMPFEAKEDFINKGLEECRGMQSSSSTKGLLDLQNKKMQFFYGVLNQLKRVGAIPYCNLTPPSSPKVENVKKRRLEYSSYYSPASSKRFKIGNENFKNQNKLLLI